jgi:hypothetical protein
LETLPLLIRLARQKADARRVALVCAEQEHRAATERMEAQAVLFQTETSRAAAAPAEMAAWTSWFRRATREAEQLRQAQALAAQRESGIRNLLAEDFAETKRLELAWEERRKAVAKLAGRRAEKRAEEVALRRIRGAV